MILLEIRPNPSAAFPNPSYVEEIRRRLRASGDSPTAQVGVVVDELADLLADTIPRLRDLSRGLRNETDDTTRQVRLFVTPPPSLFFHITFHSCTCSVAAGTRTITDDGVKVSKSYPGIKFN